MSLSSHWLWKRWAAKWSSKSWRHEDMETSTKEFLVDEVYPQKKANIWNCVNIAQRYTDIPIPTKKVQGCTIQLLRGVPKCNAAGIYQMGRLMRNLPPSQMCQCCRKWIKSEATDLGKLHLLSSKHNRINIKLQWWVFTTVVRVTYNDQLFQPLRPSLPPKNLHSNPKLNNTSTGELFPWVLSTSQYWGTHILAVPFHSVHALVWSPTSIFQLHPIAPGSIAPYPVS